MTDEEKIEDFLNLAIDQELQAIYERGLENVSWGDLLNCAKLEDGVLILQDGRGIRISAILMSKALMLRRRLATIREETFKFTMADVQAYCLDPERKKRWDREVLRPLYVPLHKIMGDKAEDEAVEAGFDEAIALMKQIQAKIEELDLVNIAEGLIDTADV